MSSRIIREIGAIASRYGLEYDGRTSRGHIRWKHIKTGRIVISVSQGKSYHTLGNVERSFRQALRRHDGQHNRPHRH